MTNPAGLRLEQIVISLGERQLLAIDAAIAPGETLTLMGPSGSGKSTVLAFLGGFLDPAFTVRGKGWSGDVELTALPPEERHVGLLFQDPLLFPHMDVGGNIALAIPQAVKGSGPRRALVAAALEGVEMSGYEHRDPDTLSGGQKARVALARVLVSHPRALLLDEPFSKLDMELRQQMRALVFDKARQSGLPVLLVTHDPADAEAAGGAVVEIGR